MSDTGRFDNAKAKLADVIARSASAEDVSHAENTLYWMLQLEPDADELLRLAAYGHDTERALDDRLRRESFDSYEKYKRAHARRSGRVVARIALESGYTTEEVSRLAHIIGEGEFASDDPEVQLMCDADSISFFDNNVAYYLHARGTDRTRSKMRFAFDRASARAQTLIRELLTRKPELSPLLSEPGT